MEAAFRGLGDQGMENQFETDLEPGRFLGMGLGLRI